MLSKEGHMKETKEEILIVVPVTVHYDSPEGRKAALKEIVKLHISVCSSHGYRAIIKRKGWVHQTEVMADNGKER